MAISYPFSVKDSELPVHQPVAHGDHPHLPVPGGPARGRMSLDRGPARVATPPPTDDTTRVLSQHYIEEIVERYAKRRPTVLPFFLFSSSRPYLTHSHPHG